MAELTVDLASNCVDGRDSCITMGQGGVLLSLIVEVAMWSRCMVRVFGVTR